VAQDGLGVDPLGFDQAPKIRRARFQVVGWGKAL
jgi:hypothetical protein